MRQEGAMRKRNGQSAVAAPVKRRQRGSPAAEAEPESMSVDEVIARYPGQWILMRVTAHDEDKWPSHGQVLAHDMSYRKVGKAWLEIIAASGLGDPERPYYIFRAERLLRTGEELRRALEERRQREDGDAIVWPLR
jgi:hypothetical protein